MPSLTPFRIRERIRSLFPQTLDNIQSLAEMKPDEIPEAEVAPPPIPTDLSSQQFPQKELVAGVEALLPEILEESKKYGSVVQIFIAITLLETVEETEAKFWFLTEQEQGLKPIILLWAQAYQDKNYMLPPLMATFHWGFTPIIW
jgi:NifB/MoaA-like Fe-S oxidoreductase